MAILFQSTPLSGNKTSIFIYLHALAHHPQNSSCSDWNPSRARLWSIPKEQSFPPKTLKLAQWEVRSQSNKECAGSFMHQFHWVGSVWEWSRSRKMVVLLKKSSHLMLLPPAQSHSLSKRTVFAHGLINLFQVRTTKSCWITSMKIGIPTQQ